jgi:hypothetical protein
MSVHGPADVFLLVGGNDLTPDTWELSDSVESLIEEVRPFGESWDKHLPIGVGKVTLTSGGGLYDDRQNGMLAALQDNNGVQQRVVYGFAGDDPGAEVTIIDGPIVTKWNRVADLGALTKASPEYVVTGQPYRARILHGRTPETADFTTETASVDNATATSTGAIADLHVTALTLGGHTALVVRVLGSADDVTFAPLGTFADVTAVASTHSQRITIAGVIPRYTAIDGDFTGAGSPSAILFVALARNA